MPFITQYNSITYVNLQTREWGDVLYNDTGIDLSGACIIDVQTLSQGICTCILAHTHTHPPVNAKRRKKSDINLLIHITVNFIKYR